jgi:geranylgeranyl reductase family protein
MTDGLYDVIIVGASFSGLMAAMNLKSKKVLVIEKRKLPGTPVNSTGAVPIEWLTKMGVFPSSDCIAGTIRGVELVGPDGASAVVKNPQPDGMVLYPDRYVNWLAERARDSGCTILTNTVFRSVTSDGGGNGSGPGLTVSTSEGAFRGRYVVGADGAASNVGLSAGVGYRPSPKDLHIGIEYTVENNHTQDPEIFRLYLGHKVAPLGYAWSFPEGMNHLRVGVGIPKSMGMTAKGLLNDFLEKYPQFKTPISKSSGGIIPTAPPLKTAVKGNVLLVGDAAHFCSPLHGGGIWFGMLSGYLAGVALSSDQPALYDVLWKRKLGGTLSRHYKLKKVIYSMSDQNFNDLISLLKRYMEIRGANRGPVRTAQQMLFADPGFVLDMAVKWFRSGLVLDVAKRALIPSFRIA